MRIFYRPPWRMKPAVMLQRRNFKLTYYRQDMRLDRRKRRSSTPLDAWGCWSPSARYKRDIRAMGNFSEALMKLRPVMFRYKDDPSQHREYGLVAEEVARVYPDLVSHDADGKVVSVRYHELVPMLLNELQQQAEQIQKQAQQIRRLNAKVAEDQAEGVSFEQRLSAERASFERRLSALERTLTARDRNQTLAADLER